MPSGSGPDIGLLVPPLVLVTTDRRALPGFKPSPRIRPNRPEVWVGEAYIEVLRASGALPLLVPPGETDIDALLALADAVVLTGGDFDIHPSWYGEAVTGRLDRVEPTRTSMELALARACLSRHVPILGVCGGMQALAVAAGGSLIQDLPKHPLDHEQPTDPATPWHEVRVTGPAVPIFGERIEVASTHHQAVRDPGSLIVCGIAPDGVTEIIGSESGFVIGVQWHPEVLGDARPFRALVAAAATG